jgi:hypothetical protein
MMNNDHIVITLYTPYKLLPWQLIRHFSYPTWHSIISKKKKKNKNYLVYFDQVTKGHNPQVPKTQGYICIYIS